MNSKGHLIASIIKSILRIVGGFITIFTGEIYPLAAFIVIAEVCGLLEEVLDNR